LRPTNSRTRHRKRTRDYVNRLGHRDRRKLGGKKTRNSVIQEQIGTAEERLGRSIADRRTIFLREMRNPVIQ